MVKTYQERIIDEEAFINTIGKITIRFALLEELITDCINILIGGEAASIFTARLSFSRSLDILDALYRQKYSIGQNEDLSGILKELITQAQEAENLRNTIVHSIWHRGDTEESLTRIKRNVKRNKGLIIDTEQMNVHDLEKIANSIENAAYSAQEFTWEILKDYITYQISPANDAVFLNAKPEFIWQRVEGAIGYELSIAKRWDFIENSVSKMGDDCVRDTKYKCEIPLEQNTEYYWRVRPIIATAQGYWSEIRRFTVR